jgi:hypothetical protein
MQALIQYPDPGSATNAKSALEGHAIYDGGYNRVSTLANLLLSVFHRLNISWWANAVQQKQGCAYRCCAYTLSF